MTLQGKRIMDSGLVSQAEIKATGQNIHTLKNILMAYGAMLFCYNKTNNAEDQTQCLTMIERIETHLRQFINTGKINPL